MQGAWRLVDEEYSVSILELVLLSAMEEDLALDSLHLEALSASLSEHEIPAQVLASTLKRYSDPSDTQTKFALSAQKVARAFGHRVLRQKGRMPLPAFLTLFNAAVPDTIKARLSDLDSLYILEPAGTSVDIVYFPLSALPCGPQQRFAALFGVRAKWDREEMLPFISGLAASQKELDAMILRFARVSRAGGKVFLTNRHTLLK